MSFVEDKDFYCAYYKAYFKIASIILGLSESGQSVLGQCEDICTTPFTGKRSRISSEYDICVIRRLAILERGER